MFVLQRELQGKKFYFHKNGHWRGRVYVLLDDEDFMIFNCDRRARLFANIQEEKFAKKIEDESQLEYLPVKVLNYFDVEP